MDQIDTPPSPCINVCRIDDAGDVCIGCLRTLDEIVAWGDADDSEKRTILALVAQRRKTSDRTK